MTLKNIANENLTLSHASGSLISGGSFTIITQPSAKVKTQGGDRVQAGSMTFSFAGGSAVGFLDGSVLAVPNPTMPPTSIKTKATNSVGALSLVMREDDTVIMNCIGTIEPPPPSPPFTGPVAGLVVISDAGQIKDKAQ